MSKKSEAGQVRNITSAEEIISHAKVFGARYNPFRDELKLLHLDKKWGEGKAVIEEVSQGYTQMNRAINNRLEVFKDLKALSTKVIGALVAAGASDETIADARYLQRKLNGRRARKIKEPAPGNIGELIPNMRTISVSQTSYDEQVEHFTRLLLLSKGQEGYKPNEAELSVSGMQQKLLLMKTANTTVIDTHATITAARNKRDEVLYHETTGLIKLAKAVKEYIKSVFGASSPEYKQVRAIPLRTIKKK